MRIAFNTLVVLVVLLLGGGTVWAWGAGWFWPCEPLGRLSGESQCNRIAALDGRQLQDYKLLADGTLLGVTRGPGTDPDVPPSLVTIDLDSGAVLTEHPIEGLADGWSTHTLIASPDEQLVMIDSLDGPAALLDREGQIVATHRWGLLGFSDFLDDAGRVISDPGLNRRGIPDNDRTMIRNLNESDTWLLPFLGPFPNGFFSRGVGTALSPDGTVYAQNLDGMRESGVAALRVGNVANLEAPGLLFAARLREGCNYFVPHIAFSPDGNRIAAAWWCPTRWGQESSALLVFDIEQNKAVARIPTDDWWSAPRWLDNDTVLVDRYHPDNPNTELFSIHVGEED